MPLSREVLDELMDENLTTEFGDTGSAFKAALDESYAPISGSTAYAPAEVGGKAPVRKDELVFNVKDYGALGNGVANDTAAINSAKSAALAVGGGVVYFPHGTYIASGILIGPRITYRGADRNTIIKPPTGDGNTFVFGMPTGPVVHAYIENLRIIANGNAGQRGIWMKGLTANGTLPAGWWWGGMKQVTVENFASDNIWLQGTGTTGAIGIHQFLTFEDVVSYPSSATGAALRISGLVGQVTVIGGEFDGPGQAVGTTNTTNVWITREVNDSLANVSVSAPYAINFEGSTIQSNKDGVYVDLARSVNFNGCYFENVDRSITANGAIVEAHGCTFANAAKAANLDGTGYAVGSTNSSKVSVRGGSITGNVDKHFVGDATNGGLVVQDVHGASPSVTTGMTPSISINGSNAITVVGSTKTCNVVSSATSLKTITSSHAPGEVFHIRATGGPVILDTGGNINLAGLGTPFTIQAGWTISLLRIDLGGTWIATGASAPFGGSRRVKLVSATTQTLDFTAAMWSFTGSTATTWTLPTLSTSIGNEYLIKNRGSADITLQRAGSDNLYTTTAATSITITPGNSARIVNDGGYWSVL